MNVQSLTAAGPPAHPGAQGPDAVLAALDPEQQQVALAARGPVCVLAGEIGRASCRERG